jgi:hypothetical protein
MVTARIQKAELLATAHAVQADATLRPRDRPKRDPRTTLTNTAGSTWLMFGPSRPDLPLSHDQIGCSKGPWCSPLWLAPAVEPPRDFFERALQKA